MNLYPAKNSRESFIAGWGRKPSFFRAQDYALRYNLQCVCLEDGFIRSLGLGKEGYPPLSLVVDYSGIYFDASQPSDLETLITEAEKTDANSCAEKAIQQILDFGITKYNQRFVEIDPSKFQQHKNILVVDQTFGDQSIPYAGASAESFKQMLQQACKDHPQAKIWVKIHPDVLAGKSKGHFSQQDFIGPNIGFLTENYNSIDLCRHMDEVYVVSSQLGFEALLCQKKVHCFGMPWYAGWGLTQDSYAPVAIVKDRRNQKRSLAHLFVCAYFKYARYVSPVTHQRCELEEIIDLLIANIQFQKQVPNKIIAYGFSRWKRRFLRDFLAFPHTWLHFQKFLKPKKDDYIVAWGKKAHLLKQQNYSQVCTVEDGFIRSLGLGAALIRPHSLVFDDVGIYYDATQPSRLENLLNRVELSERQAQRAQYLINHLVALQISKYNVGVQQHLIRPAHAKKVLLVVGQVEDDMSIQLGGVDIKRNLELLQTVRQQHSDSYIIYKPHPDVQAGLRVGKISTEIALQYADKIELETSILDCFKICDEVHTITSLSGFEALLRGLKVYCYGLPFYAGWGLTQDQHQCHRRKRQLNLQQLVYVALLQYPVYNIQITEKMRVPLVNPEQLIAYIKPSMRQSKKHSKPLLNKLFTSFRRLQIRK